MALRFPTSSAWPGIPLGTTKATDGFTVAELIIGVVLIGLALLAVIRVFITVKGQLPERVVATSGANLRVAPSESVFVDASRVHGVLIERLNEAKAVYVMGGSHVGLPTAATHAAQRPLATNGIPVISDFTSGLPMDAFAFYNTYASQLGGLQSSPDAADFSVIVVAPRAGALAVTTLVQVRNSSVVVSDGGQTETFTKRSVVLYDFDGSTWSYTFLERPSVSAAITIGASHHWYRYAEGRVAEEGPATVIFPDPWVYGGSRGMLGTFEPPSFSQFTYFMEVSP